MNAERLLRTAEHLETVVAHLPLERFRMDVWARKLPSCDTVCCAVGHACDIPEFAALGLKLWWPQEHKQYGERAEIEFEGYRGWSVSRFYDLNNKEVDYLFTEEEYWDDRRGSPTTTNAGWNRSMWPSASARSWHRKLSRHSPIVSPSITEEKPVPPVLTTEDRRRGWLASAAARRKIDRARLAELHAAGATDLALATAFNCTISAVAFARSELHLPINPDPDGRRKAGVIATRSREAKRSAVAAAAAAAHSLPVMPAAHLRIVEVLASGPKLAAQISVDAGYTSTAGRNARNPVLRSMRDAGLLTATRQPRPPGRTGEMPLLWSLAPAIITTAFARSELRPLQQKIAAQPKHLAIAAALTHRYAAACPGAADDIRSAAYAGLVDAARLFDPTKFAFITYAGHRVKGAILDAMRRNGLKGFRRNATAAPSVAAGFESFEPAVTHPVGAEADEREHFLSLTEFLSPRHRAIVRMKFLQDMDYAEIASRFNLSECRVSQLHTEALTMLRARFSEVTSRV